MHVGIRILLGIISLLVLLGSLIFLVTLPALLILFVAALSRGELQQEYRIGSGLKENSLRFIYFVKSSLQTMKIKKEIPASNWRFVNVIKLIIGINLKTSPFFCIALVTLYMVGKQGFEVGTPTMSAKIQLQNLAGWLKEYRQYCGVYPKKLSLLMKSDFKKIANDGPCEKYVSKDTVAGIEELPRDPWNQEFQYTQIENGKKYSLKSLGPDQVDSRDDIIMDSRKKDLEDVHEALEKMNKCGTGDDCVAIWGIQGINCVYLINKAYSEQAQQIIQGAQSKIQKKCFEHEYASGVACSKHRCAWGEGAMPEIIEIDE